DRSIAAKSHASREQWNRSMGLALRKSGRRRAGAKQVPQDGHVTQALELRQFHPVFAVVREPPGADEPRCALIPDKKRGKGEAQLIDQSSAEKQRIDRRTALDQQRADAPGEQVSKNPSRGNCLRARRDHRCDIPQRRTEGRRGAVWTVDELRSVTG